MKQLLFISLLLLALMSCNKQETNPLLTQWEGPYELPPFEKITLEHYKDAFDRAFIQQEKDVQTIIDNQSEATFENTIVALDRSHNLLYKIALIFSSATSADSSPELLKLETEIAPRISAHSDNILMNPALFERVKFVYDNKNNYNLDREDAKLLEETYKSFVRNGALLSPEDKESLKNINGQISTLETAFEQNVLAETASYELLIENDESLSGLPEDLIESAEKRAKKAGKEGFQFGLDNPSIMPFLQFSDMRVSREEMLNAYLNRCNNNNDKDNKEIIQKLIDLRSQKAKLLGYENFADYVLTERMAKTPQAVYKLLDQIWTPALKMANTELKDMKALSELSPFEASDWRYYSEKIKQQRYDLSDEMVRPYFKSENVRDGIFWLCNQLWGISFTALENVPKPHPDAEAFVCLDADGKTELGVLYIDLSARPGTKRGGAWCGTYRDPSVDANGNRIIPITYIVCNFSPPSESKPALLSADETETFFHEFGHAIHNLFKNVRYIGTTDTPTDFVELPSQIMEHWAFEPAVLAQYAKHYETGEVIPQELVEKIDKASKFGQGFRTTEYLAASYLDMDYHTKALPKDFDVLAFEAKTLSDRGLISQIPLRYRSTYFRHVMGGGYTAGYYSYIWSEVLDADAFKAFVETGDIFNKEVAAKYRKFIVEPGGSEEADVMYRNFRGAEPHIDGLLENRGLK
ncbi:MAG: M3 family metallopeptidase [Dysgonamonadaceae bacterium]|jgi:peptidyl-dipeptidase Dcp|nr:M3 family metallopeptidase [Dysgonamonadaceae bacterium]